MVMSLGELHTQLPTVVPGDIDRLRESVGVALVEAQMSGIRRGVRIYVEDIEALLSAYDHDHELLAANQAMLARVRTAVTNYGDSVATYPTLIHELREALNP